MIQKQTVKIIIISAAAISFMAAVGLIIPKFTVKNPDISSSPCAVFVLKSVSKFPAAIYSTPRIKSFSISKVEIDFITIFGLKYNTAITLCDYPHKESVPFKK